VFFDRLASGLPSGASADVLHLHDTGLRIDAAHNQDVTSSVHVVLTDLDLGAYHG
jgi:hypothetical protein